jgi:hypothetical protein
MKIQKKEKKNDGILLHKTQFTKPMSNASLQTTGHLQTEKKSNEIDPNPSALAYILPVPASKIMHCLWASCSIY